VEATVFFIDVVVEGKYLVVIRIYDLPKAIVSMVSEVILPLFNFSLASINASKIISFSKFFVG
jgi:hypothetical protein